MQGSWVLSLIWQLRFHMLRGQKKKKNTLLLMEESAWSWQWRPHSLVPLWLSMWIRLSPSVTVQTESLLFPGRVKKGMWMPKSQCQNSLHLVAIKGERKSRGSFNDVNCFQEIAMLPFTPSSLEPAQTLNGPHSTAQHVVWQSWAHAMAFSGAQDLARQLPVEQGWKSEWGWLERNRKK